MMGPSPPCIWARTSPSETSPRAEKEGPSLRTVYGGCFGVGHGGLNKPGGRAVECCAVPHGTRTFWSSSERVHQPQAGAAQRKAPGGKVDAAAEGKRSGLKPGQVIAFICGLIVIILMIMALASTDWLMAAGWRQGLFIHCIGENAPTPLPFNQQAPPDCYQARDVAYIRAAAALCIITLITDVFATILTGLGLKSKDHRTKYKYYRVAVYIMVLSLISILIALVVYPVCFAAELNEGNRTVWEFGWAYGVGWGAAIFLFGGVVLLLCDKESEEIYYKERKIVHDTDSRA
ncbi:transmembrane protein 47 isoform X1 [Hetaerina americana]|uniref:transmembrane protein 47 isoform X1 n=1 Tax=Hetaerina americana TaxID=62018 RepID=UPI003A7F21BF